MRNLKTFLISVSIALGLLASNNAFSDGEKKFQVSTYDAPQYKSKIANQRKTLSELENSKAFDIIHDYNFSKIALETRDLFKQRKEYKILSVAAAD